MPFESQSPDKSLMDPARPPMEDTGENVFNAVPDAPDQTFFSKLAELVKGKKEAIRAEVQGIKDANLVDTGHIREERRMSLVEQEKTVTQAAATLDARSEVSNIAPEMAARTEVTAPDNEESQQKAA